MGEAANFISTAAVESGRRREGSYIFALLLDEVDEVGRSGTLTGHRPRTGICYGWVSDIGVHSSVAEEYGVTSSTEIPRPSGSRAWFWDSVSACYLYFPLVRCLLGREV